MNGGSLAQLPTAVLGILLILVGVSFAVVVAYLVHDLVPAKVRESHTVPLGLINGALNLMFGVIVGFTSFLVLGEYTDAQQALQDEALRLPVWRTADYTW